MDISQLTIRILLLIIPGMISSCIYEFITRKNSDTKKFICSVIFSSFICYLLVLLFYNLGNLIFYGINGFSSKNIVFFDALLSSDIQIKYIEIIYASIIGFVLGIIKTIIMNKGFVFKFLRFLRLTDETGNDVWYDLFGNNTKGIKDYVYVVKSAENKVYGGFVSKFSRNSDNPELLLTNVGVYENINRPKKLYDVDKVYFNLKSDDITIELRNNK